MQIRTISEELKQTYGQKIYRLALSSGCSCPNRDGKLSYGGCTFCSEGGSGEFAAPLLPLDQQIEKARKRVDKKIPAGQTPAGRRYIAYFQAFTNTYARNAEELQRLEALYTEAIRRPEIVILSLGTRPDCLGPEVLAMLGRVQAAAPEKPIWIELGLQTAHDGTAERINRGYDWETFLAAHGAVKAAGYRTVLHVILGLPGETEADILETMRRIGQLDPLPDGIKLQLLQVLKGTALAEEYADGGFDVLSMEDYTDLVVKCLQTLPREITVHRMTGDAPKSLLIAPKWCGDKKRVLNMLTRKIKEAGAEG